MLQNYSEIWSLNDKLEILLSLKNNYCHGPFIQSVKENKKNTLKSYGNV